MGNGFAGIGAVVDDEAVAAFEDAELARYGFRGEEHPAKQPGIGIRGLGKAGMARLE